MITKQQWYNIHNQHLGLRSEDNQTVIKGTGASYAMDMGERYKLNDPAPANWEDLLKGTIKRMKEFVDSKNRYLMIVDQSSGNSTQREYMDTFPKSSSRSQNVKFVISLNNSTEDLAEWVEKLI